MGSAGRQGGLLMKTALLHYWLTGMRGGEMVLAEICRLFSDADIYTHACLPEKLVPEITSHPIHESLIARMPGGRKHCQKYLPLMPYAVKQWDFSGYDLIISSESGPVKGICKPANARHICYCHTPMRYLWDMYDFYYREAGFSGKAAMRIFKNFLRRCDLESADSVDEFIANSQFVAERIKRIYNRESTVIYPPVDVKFFADSPELERKHYLFVSSLVCYKRPELVLRAFARLPEEKLLVIGAGPLKTSLQKAAPGNVSFLSDVSKVQLRELYASAKALIFPGIEDFGIIPVEAQAAGCPVIAMNTGGTAETVIDRVSGIHMNEQSVENILQAIEELNGAAFDRKRMVENAERFSTETFRRNFSAMVDRRGGSI